LNLFLRMDLIPVGIIKMIDIGTAKFGDKVYVIKYNNAYDFRIYGTEILEIIKVPFYAYEYGEIMKPFNYQTQFKLKGIQEPQLCGYMFYTYSEAKNYVFRKYDNQYLQNLQKIQELKEDIKSLKPILAKIKNNELLEEIV